ncbi:Protein CBG05307 [Caenorhabditis briggsae]|uniref:Uncharacterized protein n=2 Tax=Caenorhabditis briggsae TaxID=6238 RepID=A0AAE9CXA8_CAEBR|nr:Protein CBG05307 [Caenorhabditis briggsae]ULT84255.1 hypothetical protein L3Y34_013128 [Caenorhabditis briggsae]CAP25813.1 Protein CBG05307 [Caenorhabditis briggsae]
MSSNCGSLDYSINTVTSQLPEVRIDETEVIAYVSDFLSGRTLHLPTMPDEKHRKNHDEHYEAAMEAEIMAGTVAGKHFREELLGNDACDNAFINNFNHYGGDGDGFVDISQDPYAMDGVLAHRVCNVAEQLRSLKVSKIKTKVQKWISEHQKKSHMKSFRRRCISMPPEESLFGFWNASSTSPDTDNFSCVRFEKSMNMVNESLAAPPIDPRSSTNFTVAKKFSKDFGAWFFDRFNLDKNFQDDFGLDKNDDEYFKSGLLVIYMPDNKKKELIYFRGVYIGNDPSDASRSIFWSIDTADFLSISPSKDSLRTLPMEFHFHSNMSNFIASSSDMFKSWSSLPKYTRLVDTDNLWNAQAKEYIQIQLEKEKNTGDETKAGSGVNIETLFCTGIYCMGMCGMKEITKGIIKPEKVYGTMQWVADKPPRRHRRY